MTLWFVKIAIGKTSIMILGVVKINSQFPKFDRCPAWGNQEVRADVDCGIRQSRPRRAPRFPSVSPIRCFRSHPPLPAHSSPQKGGGGWGEAETWHGGHGTPSRSLVTRLGMARARLIRFFCELDGLRGSIQPVVRCCITDRGGEASCDLFKHSIIQPLLLVIVWLI